MAFRPNYNQQRGDRDRAKEQKKKERRERREEDARKRKAEQPDGVAVSDSASSEPEAPSGNVENK